MKTALVDYGAGNLSSVRKALAYVGLDVTVPRSADDLHECGAMIIPGVGHFEALSVLDTTFRSAVLRHVRRGRPLLGICLGLQWLFEGSDEAPGVPGLGLLEGRCFRLRGAVKVPHVGWNSLDCTRPSELLGGAEGGAAYFTHSFAAPVGEATVATTTHGGIFASVVEKGNLFGVQWHPEKSGETGLTVLRNFSRIVAGC